MSKIKVIIDTDPGNDDLLAIVMALNSSKLDLLGLTVVGGNATIEDTTNNALSILTYMKRTDIPVYIGDPSALNEKFTNDFFVAALGRKTQINEGDRSIHHVRFSKNFDQVIFEDIIPIGERIEI